MIGFRARSGTGLPQRLEALEAAAELADDRLDEASVAFARHVAGKARARLRHGTTITLVSLLGATGSGKSSVANLLIGDEVATTGVRRPTTSSTLACIFGGEVEQDDVDALLDWLEVVNRHRVPPGEGIKAEAGRALDGLVLLDVPDHDSVAEAHREEMERIAEHADMLLWITDPEKYADKAMHDYLARLSGHGAVMALALNKTDLLTPVEIEACRTDLKRLLAEAGLEDTPVIVLSATTGHGRDTLQALLADTVQRKRAVTDRLSADTALAADALLDELGDEGGPERVPRRVAERLSEDLVAASGIETVADAVAAGHRRDAARVTGWPFTRWTRRLRPHPLGRFHLGPGSAGRASLPEPSGVQRARTQGAIRSATDAVTVDLPEPWPEHIRSVALPRQNALNDRLDLAIGDAARQAVPGEPRWWSVVNLLQLALAASAVAGLVWLGLLALAAYLQLPDIPTPEVRGFPVPTGLLIGGLLFGLLLAALAGRLARLGALRRARAVRRQATDAVDGVARELVIDPIDAELARRHELRGLLERAAGRSR